MPARLDSIDFRRALGHFATGVTVATARGLDARPVGITANSFASVSLEPPLVLWCLARRSPSLPHFARAERFGISVLAADQRHLSIRFAQPGIERFEGVALRNGLAGVPLIAGAIATFDCRRSAIHDGGDHVIIVGEVERYAYTGGAPLVFHSGIYRVVTTHPELDL